MEPLANIALGSALKAGRYLTQAWENLDPSSVEEKGLNDFVTQVDRASEQIIVEQILKAHPDHSILAEEQGLLGNADSEYQWVIDPLDGTTNFIHGFPQFAISIAVKYKGKLEHGVVHDPLRQEDFVASRGRGAQLNGKRIRISKRRSLEGALLGTGFPFKRDQQTFMDEYLAMFSSLALQTAGIRRPGAAALDLAYVAAGRLDGFWEFGLQEWDMAAGALLIREAGGLVTDFSGGEDFLKTGNIVAGTPKVLRDILKSIHPCLPAELKK